MATELNPNYEGNDAIATTGDSKGDIQAALKKIAAKQIKIDRYCRYYDGIHRFNFASEKFHTQFAKQLHTFRDNLCKTVVKAPADRLEVTGFASDANSEIYKQSWSLWKYSQMPRLAKRIHRDAFKTGDAFVIVYTDEYQNARIYPQDSKNCTVFYDPETGKIEFGAKVWRGNDRRIYLTMYYPDRTEKYISRNVQSPGNFPTTAASFTRRIISGENWPLKNEIGTPAIFHFGLECSILEDVIPLQEALNKEIADMLIGSEANSLRQRWTAGIQYEIDTETGEQIIPFKRASQWFTAEDKDATFGEFKDVVLKDFLDVINDFRSEIANVSGIPEYYFRLDKAQFPSGEALGKAESRFVSIVADAQLDFGETWADVMTFAMKAQGEMIADANEEIDAAAGTTLETKWTPAAAMSENEKLDLAIKKQTVGVSQEKNLSEIGYTDEEITEMQDQNQTKATNAADAFGKVFDAGSLAAGGPTPKQAPAPGEPTPPAPGKKGGKAAGNGSGK